MALIALTSAKGAPGVTTTALALTLRWPRDVVLVEADLAGSSILPGFFRGQLEADTGLVPLALANSHGELTDRFLEQAIPLDPGAPQARLVAGLPSPLSGGAVRALWGPLAAHLATLGRGGVDVIVDLGRLAPLGDDREPILQLADMVLFCTGSRIPDVDVTSDLVAARTAHLEDADRALSNLGMLIIGPGRSFSTKEASRELGLPAVAVVAWDPVSAEVLSIGAKPARRFNDAPLMRSIESAIDSIQGRVTYRLDLLTGTHQEVR